MTKSEDNKRQEGAFQIFNLVANGYLPLQLHWSEGLRLFEVIYK